MKRLIIAALLLSATLTACTEKPTAVETKISGRFIASNVDSLYLERISDDYATTERIAAHALCEDDSFEFSFDVDHTTPRFYRLRFSNNTRPIMLAVAAGDNISLDSAGDIFLNYEVEGSEESALIREFNRAYYTAADRLARIAEKAHTQHDVGIDWEMEAYSAAREAITEQVRFVGANQESLAAFYALHQSVAEEYIPQLAGYGISNAHRQSVATGIGRNYPDSPYIEVLKREILEEQAVVDIVNNISLASFPDIELKDMYKQTHRLSEYEGKVVLLYFWTATDARCNNINAELKPLYEKYHDRGFEVYQVSADSDIAMWIRAVRQQSLPWVSLYGGDDRTVFSLYNISQLPTAFLIDRKGDMTLCSLNMSALESDIERLL